MDGLTPVMVPAHGDLRHSDADPRITYMVNELGADLHWADASGQTALHIAAKRNYINPIRLYLAAGADPDAEDEDGKVRSLSCGVGAVLMRLWAL